MERTHIIRVLTLYLERTETNVCQSIKSRLKLPASASEQTEPLKKIKGHSSDPPCKDSNVGFTMVPLKP